MAGLERQGGVSGFLSKLWKQACSLCWYWQNINATLTPCASFINPQINSALHMLRAAGVRCIQKAVLNKKGFFNPPPERSFHRLNWAECQFWWSKISQRCLNDCVRGFGISLFGLNGTERSTQSWVAHYYAKIEQVLYMWHQPTLPHLPPSPTGSVYLSWYHTRKNIFFLLSCFLFHTLS